MKRYTGIVLSLAILGLITAIAFLPNTGKTNYTSNSDTEYVIPGAPKAPMDLEDWFTRGKKDSENPSLSKVLQRARHPFLSRIEKGQLVIPTRTFIQPQTLSDGKIVEGFSFKYSDRIAISVDPVSSPLDIEREASKEMIPANIKGETKVRFKVRVRGVEGVGREAGIQKWESGAENHYPAVVYWTEEGEGDIPYLLYGVMGDRPVSELVALANALQMVEKNAMQAGMD